MSAARLGRVLYPVVAFALVVAAWEAYVRAFDVSELLLPAPAIIGEALVDRWDLLLTNGLYTLRESALGFLLAVAVGVPIAIAITYSRVLQVTIYPWLIASQSVPKVAIAPIVLLWLGIGASSRVVIALLVAFFPIVINTATGLGATPREMLDLTRSLRASPWHTFAKVRMRHALPHLFSGLKIAVALAVVGAVIGEFVGSQQGLGHLLLVATSQANAPLAFASLVSLSVLGILLFVAVVVAEKLATPWAAPLREEGIP